ncbi:nitroreductase family deazaflavin-dependent oxidoreductase [Fodinicola acaciae]|uniref:nitroreductase family deazaflavin-dependent oxidoreductase n=1 Tax=Fodinicola acaciae TaxID=2681555 RepID=UPI001C9E5B1F|nr:nitroreductase family deazaflavin-dependent oxidoreductase [Fodinicola acaciae]
MAETSALTADELKEFLESQQEGTPPTAEQINRFNVTIIEDFRAHNGTVTIPPFAGGPIVLLHHKGAKSGKERVAPLAYDRDGDDVIIIASKGGAPENPAWYHNLLANPDTTIELGPDTWDVRAEALTEGPERDRLYQAMADKMPNFHEYQKNTDRIIPVVRLRRR